MEHCFTLALMLLLVGQIQANPITTTKWVEMEDLEFEFMDNVSCPNVTFSCPTNVTCGAALECFTERLTNGTTKCEDDDSVIQGTLEVLKGKTVPQTPCEWNIEESPKTFHKFMEDFKRLIEKINNLQ